jgi:hypothetical protein
MPHLRNATQRSSSVQMHLRNQLLSVDSGVGHGLLQAQQVVVWDVLLQLQWVTYLHTNHRLDHMSAYPTDATAIICPVKPARISMRRNAVIQTNNVTNRVHFKSSGSWLEKVSKHQPIVKSGILAAGSVWTDLLYDTIHCHVVSCVCLDWLRIGHCTSSLDKYVPKFQRNIPPPSSG